MLPDTINLHFTPYCNARCQFCFAKYSEVQSPCSTQSLKKIIDLIAQEPASDQLRRVNFVGGEPTIHKDLPALLTHAKLCGLQTSIVSNGLEMLIHSIEPYAGCTDMIGLSIDSIAPNVIAQAGRLHRTSGYLPDRLDWLNLAGKIHNSSIKLKINTVVQRLNHDEDMNDFIAGMTPRQWKIFQVTKIDGQNDIDFQKWKIRREEFNNYCFRHRNLVKQGIRVTHENSDLMLNSYAIIGPNGCFVDNASGKHLYSRPIEEVGIVEAWAEIRFDSESFVARRGLGGPKKEVAYV
ncbi:MAG: radical SAM protein [Desulforhopalus sp.]|nr:radical SAM protein [Desulforhopalus sp.]